MLGELDLTDNRSVNEWIDKVIYTLKSCYYQGEFNKLIKILNNEIPEVIIIFNLVPPK